MVAGIENQRIRLFFRKRPQNPLLSLIKSILLFGFICYPLLAFTKSSRVIIAFLRKSADLLFKIAYAVSCFNVSLLYYFDLIPQEHEIVPRDIGASMFFNKPIK